MRVLHLCCVVMLSSYDKLDANSHAVVLTVKSWAPAWVKSWVR